MMIMESRATSQKNSEKELPGRLENRKGWGCLQLDTCKRGPGIHTAVPPRYHAHEVRCSGIFRISSLGVNDGGHCCMLPERHATSKREAQPKPPQISPLKFDAGAGVADKKSGYGSTAAKWQLEWLVRHESAGIMATDEQLSARVKQEAAKVAARTDIARECWADDGGTPFRFATVEIHCATEYNPTMVARHPAHLPVFFNPTH
ncbi:hypothetical protein CC78DRAFT_576278 [Lojkania enalia]|uniref:Uncharacterized protein n=1 Tax=Lojkania enalia TaxID=147567 RepID=A0A9P4KJA1_9PLEO|nr:hypothetical protein CC78DRAFT_576278 [Didymosphaeria enalia]